MRKIIYNSRFESEILGIVEFIAGRDGFARAEKLYDEIYAKIAKIPYMPFAYRLDPMANDKNTRDLIYKGYTVPFHISSDKIEILGIYKANLWSGE